MFKNLLLFLDKPNSDVIADRIDKEPLMDKYWFQLSATILFSTITIIIGFISFLRYETKDSPVTYAINLTKKTQQELNILPFPHQSFDNVSSWIVDAVTASYSFDFNQYDKQVNRASYFFTPDGYSTYLTALETNKIRENVVGKRLQISLIPLQLPAYSNGGTFGTTEFWRFKMPVLVSYYGGKEPVLQKTMVEVLVLRVPAHENFKGLAIAEFNMSPL